MIGELVVYGLVVVAVVIFVYGKRENLNSIGNVSGMFAAILGPFFVKADQDAAAAKAAVDSMNSVVNPANAEFQKYSGADKTPHTTMNSYANQATAAANSAKQLADSLKTSKDVNYIKQTVNTSVPDLKAKAESNAAQAKAAAPAVMAAAQSARAAADKAAADAAAAKAAADKAAADKAAADAAKAKQPVPAAPAPAVPVSTPAPVGPSPSMASGSAYAASCSKCLLVNNQLSCSCDVTPR